MSDILGEILEHKRREVIAAKARRSAEEMAQAAIALQTPTRSFRAAISVGEGPRVIAELKRRSPSKGEIRPNFDPVACALAYHEGGAVALSVLTDERYFGGHLDYLAAVRARVPLPLLRKDFVVDRYQIDEARVHGADAVLLIVRALDPGALAELRAYAVERGLDTLVEIHDEAELEIALGAGAEVIGINNRDLYTFKTDLVVTERLAPRLADAGVVVVGESGINHVKDIRRLEEAGAHAVLVGESLMREPDVANALRALRGVQ